MQQQFTPEEAEAILAQAVRRSLEESPTLAPTAISRERLELMAGELGIEREVLARILAERTLATATQQEQESVAQLRALFIAQRRQEFVQHLIPYVLVNGMLIWLNLRSSPHFLWVIFPLLGWGIGLFGHAAEALPSRGALFEEKFEKWRRKREKRAKKTESA